MSACEIIAKRVPSAVDPKKKRNSNRDDGFNSDPNAPKTSELSLPDFSSASLTEPLKSQTEIYSIEHLQMGSFLFQDSTQDSANSELKLSTGMATISEELKP